MTYDVAVLGGGVAGAAAAHSLGGLKVLLLEAESFIGGRTWSEQYPGGLWANYGAGYFSSDKRVIIGLGDAVGVKFVRFDDAALTGDFLPGAFDAADVAEIRQIKRRLAQEQSRRRDPASPELDRVSFAEWLGPMRPNVQFYWQMWCATMSAPMQELSLYGALLMSGSNRTAAFTDEPVEYDPRGNLVVEGGNGLIAVELARQSSADVKLETTVTAVTGNAQSGYRIDATTPGGSTSFFARAVICALPAPVAEHVVSDLPDWKREALASIRYGRIIGLPVVVGPKEGDYPRFEPKQDFRQDAVYCETEFLLRSPTDLDKRGAYFVCQVYDRASDVLWDDEDESLRAGVFAAFARKFPELAPRVMKIGVRRWLHGLPKYSLGRMAITPQLVQALDGISFCGDYTDVTHTDGAARSGLRAAAEVRQFLSSSVEA